MIIGLGNILLSDEGVGVHLIHQLKALDQIQNAEYLDLGTSSYEIANHIDHHVEKLIIIDCLCAKDMAPGSTTKLSIKDLQPSPSIRFSLHQLALIDSLKLISIDSSLPETMIIGVVPYDTHNFSTDLSKELTGKFHEIAQKVEDMIAEFIND